MGGNILHHSGCDLHIGWRRIGISSTHDPDSRIQHHVNSISIQLWHDEDGCPIESLMREYNKEDKAEQSDNS